MLAELQADVELRGGAVCKSHFNLFGFVSSRSQKRTWACIVMLATSTLQHVLMRRDAGKRRSYKETELQTDCCRGSNALPVGLWSAHRPVASAAR